MDIATNLAAFQPCGAHQTAKLARRWNMRRRGNRPERDEIPGPAGQVRLVGWFYPRAWRGGAMPKSAITRTST